MNATLEELQARWPLFKYHETKNFYGDEPQFTVWLSPRNENDNGSTSTSVSGTIDEKQIEALDGYHARLQTLNLYHAKFPNLWFYIDQYTYRITGAYVRRDGRDGEGISVHGDALRDPLMLDHLNAEAGKALQDGWFWCSNCDVAKPESEYGYFHFAGKYCRSCRDKNPQKYKEARSESYN